MSLNPLLTNVTPARSLYAALGAGGGGGGGQNLIVSTISLEGTNAPITATLPANPNDGFEVRGGGGGPTPNVVVVATRDENEAGQTEFGIRTLSTISGSAVPIGRFEMQADGAPTDVAQLIYQFDKAGSGSASTIGSVQFKPGTAPDSGVVVINAEDGLSATFGNGNLTVAPTGTSLIPLRATALNSGNIYVPAAGTVQTVAQFSTIAGHAYELYIPNLRVQNQPVGTPAAGAWCQLTIDNSPITYIDTFDMASVSTIANDLQKAPVYNFLASASAHQLLANGSLANTLSTAITIGGAAIVYLRDLGAPASMTVDG